jgi:hypothetical protein
MINNEIGKKDIQNPGVINNPVAESETRSLFEIHDTYLRKIHAALKLGTGIPQLTRHWADDGITSESMWNVLEFLGPKCLDKLSFDEKTTIQTLLEKYHTKLEQKLSDLTRTDWFSCFDRHKESKKVLATLTEVNKSFPNAVAKEVDNNCQFPSFSELNKVQTGDRENTPPQNFPHNSNLSRPVCSNNRGPGNDVENGNLPVNQVNLHTNNALFKVIDKVKKIPGPERLDFPSLADLKREVTVDNQLKNIEGGFAEDVRRLLTELAGIAPPESQSKNRSYRKLPRQFESYVFLRNCSRVVRLNAPYFESTRISLPNPPTAEYLLTGGVAKDVMKFLKENGTEKVYVLSDRETDTLEQIDTAKPLHTTYFNTERKCWTVASSEGNTFDIANDKGELTEDACKYFHGEYSVCFTVFVPEDIEKYVEYVLKCRKENGELLTATQIRELNADIKHDYNWANRNMSQPVVPVLGNFDPAQLDVSHLNKNPPNDFRLLNVGNVSLLSLDENERLENDSVLGENDFHLLGPHTNDFLLLDKFEGEPSWLDLNKPSQKNSADENNEFHLLKKDEVELLPSSSALVNEDAGKEKWQKLTNNCAEKVIDEFAKRTGIERPKFNYADLEPWDEQLEFISFVGYLNMLLDIKTKTFQNPHDAEHRLGCGLGQDIVEFLKKSDPNRFYVMRTGYNQGAGHFQLVYFDSERKCWAAYSSEKNNFYITKQNADANANADHLLTDDARARFMNSSDEFAVHFDVLDTGDIEDYENFVVECRNQKKTYVAIPLSNNRV